MIAWGALIVSGIVFVPCHSFVLFPCVHNCSGSSSHQLFPGHLSLHTLHMNMQGLGVFLGLFPGCSWVKKEEKMVTRMGTFWEY